jgi:acetyl esterase/lipase
MGDPTRPASLGQQPSGGETSTVKSAISFPRQRSRGQLARRNSITKGNDASRNRRRGGQRRANAMRDARHPTSPSSIGRGTKPDRPWLGGLFFTDLVFIAFTYSINLLRTLGLAELADIAFKGLMYALTRLPYDFYQRWTLSTPPSTTSATRSSSIEKRKLHRRRRTTSKLYKSGSSSESDSQDIQHQPLAFTSSHEPEPEYTLSHSPDQLSAFHHAILLLIRFTCSNFPHLVPRVLFAEETIGPFVYWRTGGGSNTMVQEFTDMQDRQLPAITPSEKSSSSSINQKTAEPAFRAYLLSKDARLPIEVQRSNLASRKATTLLYLHGGGFSLGSVAFYAEALLRIRAKVCALEAMDGNEDNVADARCVAVEYDLSPAARFPTPLLQCLRCYAHLIEVEMIDPNSICIAGDSAGGNLAMGLLLCLDGQMKTEPLLAERDWSKLPMPGKALLISPWVDLRPSHAHAFSTLRDPSKKSRSPPKDESEGKEKKNQDKGWADAVAAYEWDYVASEALLHFAQVYTGVLPHPRRVRGPIGWIAHVCGVVAKEYGGEIQHDKEKYSSYMDPMGAVSAIVRPSKRLARATHDMLSDPLLSRFFGQVDVQDEEMSREIGDPAVTSGSKMEPLFTAPDRKTDLVASKSQLFESIQNEQSAAERVGRAKGGADHERLQAELILDTHPLLSPAIGDWSNIHLKGGFLVTWGERERMADDIEAWIDSVYRNEVDDKDAPPAQDGESQPKQSRKRDRMDNEDDLAIETAVERGPGGVHAWPFVSMYLAGSEAERERGLDLLADFIARTPVEASTPGGQAIEDPMGSLNDLPHAAPDSPVSETASVGSMPSDVDLHGMVDEDYLDNYHQSTSSIDIVEAVRKANERVLQEQIRAEEAARRSRASSDPNSQPFPKIPVQTQKVKSILGAQVQRIQLPPRIMTERERGRSRSPRRTEGLSSKMSPSFVSPVRLHRPDAMPSQSSQTPPATAGQSVMPLWWTSPAAKDDTANDKVAPKQDIQDEELINQPSQDLEDIQEVSPEGTSPPSQDDQADLDDGEADDQEAMRALSLAPLNISHYGLSHFAIQRPEPEGLSDIAEEGSVLSASITSAAGIASRSLSPEGDHQSGIAGRGEMSPQTSLTAASMILSEQEWNERWQRPRWPVEEEEDEPESVQASERPQSVERLQNLFSPTSNPHFGLDTPLIYHQANQQNNTEDSAAKSQTSPSTSEGSPASGTTPKKKPKGEVWW